MHIDYERQGETFFPSLLSFFLFFFSPSRRSPSLRQTDTRRKMLSKVFAVLIDLLRVLENTRGCRVCSRKRGLCGVGSEAEKTERGIGVDRKSSCCLAASFHPANSRRFIALLALRLLRYESQEESTTFTGGKWDLLGRSDCCSDPTVMSLVVSSEQMELQRRDATRKTVTMTCLAVRLLA